MALKTMTPIINFGSYELWVVDEVNDTIYATIPIPEEFRSVVELAVENTHQAGYDDGYEQGLEDALTVSDAVESDRTEDLVSDAETWDDGIPAPATSTEGMQMGDYGVILVVNDDGSRTTRYDPEAYLKVAAHQGKRPAGE